MAAIRILVIPGALRRASFNRALARAALERMPAGAEASLFELHGVPLYDGDVEAAGFPPGVAALRAAIAGANGVLIVTPEYNYSVPGVLKNAIDWASRGPDQPLRRKTVAIAGASNGGFGSARAQLALRQVLAALDARVLNRPELMVSTAQEKFDADLKLVDEKTRTTLGKLVDALVARAGSPEPE